jgi:hypothetical protein
LDPANSTDFKINSEVCFHVHFKAILLPHPLILFVTSLHVQGIFDAEISGVGTVFLNCQSVGITGISVIRLRELYSVSLALFSMPTYIAANTCISMTFENWTYLCDIYDSE